MHVFKYGTETIADDFGIPSLFTMCAMCLINNRIVIAASDHIVELVEKIRLIMSSKVNVQKYEYFVSSVTENDQCWITSYKPLNVMAYFFEKRFIYWLPNIEKEWKVIQEHRNFPITELVVPFIKKEYKDRTLIIYLGSGNYFEKFKLYNRGNYFVTDVHQIFWKCTKSERDFKYSKVLRNDYCEVAKRVNPNFALDNFELIDNLYFDDLINIVKFWNINKDLLKDNKIFQIIVDYVVNIEQYIKQIKDSNIHGCGSLDVFACLIQSYCVDDVFDWYSTLSTQSY